MRTHVALALAILASFQVFCHGKELGSFASPHIINGVEVKPHSIPYQVALKKLSTGFFCGGSLISDRWVLTAAHCAEVTNYITVVIGAHNLNKKEDGLEVLVEKRVIHPKWFSWFGNTGDIALLKLKHSVELGNEIKPVRLPRLADKNTLFLDSEATMSGWGQVSFWQSTSAALRATTDRVMSMFRCKAAFLFLLVSDSHICTTGWNSRATCFGDSGGPLVVTESDGEQTLVGITAFGLPVCSWIWPSVFTRVTSYLDWIHAETGIARRP